MIDLPSVIPIRDIQWGREEVRGSTESPFTFHRQTFIHPGERWVVTFSMPQMDRATAAEVSAFLSKLEGGEETFLFGDVFQPLPRGSWLGTPQVNGGSQTGKSLAIKGLTPSITGIGKAGDWISIDDYLYRVMADFNSNGSGNATANIWPRLRSSPANSTIIETEEARGTFQLAGPSGTLYQIGISGFYSIPAIKIVEAF